MKYVMGLDVGTQSTKLQLYDENLKLIATVSKEQFVDTPKPLWMTQKASGWLSRLADSIAEIKAKTGINADDIAAFGCCAHMHGCVPVTEDGTVLTDDIQLYSDKRGGALAEALGEQMTDELFDISANMPIASWHGIKIKWIKENDPEMYEKTYKFLTPKDFINFTLTGRACVDYSEGTGTFLMDRKTLTWSDTMIRFLGIDREKLPEIQKAYEVVGNVSEKAAKQFGLSTKTLVITGGGDMFSMLFVSGMHKKGAAVDITGTGGTISAYTEEPVMDRRIMNIHHVLEGWVPFGNIDAAGISFRYLRDNLAKQERDAALAKGVDEYAALCSLAAETPAGAGGLYFLPYLMGERTMGTPNSRACFIGISMEKSLGHFVRAVLEGVAFEFKRTLDIFEEAGNPVSAVYHTGGAAKGDFWNQIKADIYEKPVYTLKTDEGGVLGAAIMAAYAAGFVKDLVAGADEVVKIKKIYEPNQANFGVYREMKGMFGELHDILQDPFRKMARIQEKY